MNRNNQTLIRALRHRHGAAMANLKDRADRENMLLNHLAHDCIDLARDIAFLCNIAESHPDAINRASAKAIRDRVNAQIRFRDFDKNECGAFDNS